MRGCGLGCNFERDSAAQAWLADQPRRNRMKRKSSHDGSEAMAGAFDSGLGGVAIEGLLGKTVGITRLRGQWQTYRDIPLMPTYHPAYLLRNQALSEKRKVWEDMLQVLEKLGQPISEKQRGYFLKG